MQFSTDTEEKHPIKAKMGFDNSNKKSAKRCDLFLQKCQNLGRILREASCRTMAVEMWHSATCSATSRYYTALRCIIACCKTPFCARGPKYHRSDIFVDSYKRLDVLTRMLTKSFIKMWGTIEYSQPLPPAPWTSNASENYVVLFFVLPFRQSRQRGCGNGPETGEDSALRRCVPTPNHKIVAIGFNTKRPTVKHSYYSISHNCITGLPTKT